MSTVAMNNLWTYIESLGLSNRNRKWLAEKLIEPTKADVTRKQEVAVTDSFIRGMNEVAEAEKNGIALESLDELISDLEKTI